MHLVSKCLYAFVVCFAADTEVDMDAAYKTQAGAYFEALIAADAEKADQLITVPYSLDGERVLKSVDEVKAIHQTIATRKGKRPIPKYAVEKTDKAPPLDASVFAKYVAYRVTIENSKKHVDVYLTVGDAPKVIGFTD